MVTCKYYNIFCHKCKSLQNINSIFLVLFIIAIFLSTYSYGQKGVRTDIPLDDHWKTIMDVSNKNAFDEFTSAGYNDRKWKSVKVPHNWDDYFGYRRLRHGNLHGYAWYRKSFSLKPQPSSKRIFLYFEGVGSYASVWLNGKKVAYHAGGRTTFTIDITNAVRYDKNNLLAVRADHPPNIQDLPWVCGGCSEDRGFSEGSQPLGIFRPVHLIITDVVRVKPFGVHIWNDTTISQKAAILNCTTELKNYSKQNRTITVVTKILNAQGSLVNRSSTTKQISSGSDIIVTQKASIVHPRLWSLEDPYLYKVVTDISENGMTIDRVITPYGIRWISWPIGKQDSKQFFLNGKPVFINGIAEYEHLLGDSHAFSSEQILTRAKQVVAAGFNAFRDAHQPHNLRYQNYWDSLGILWWPQLSAHDWYDTPAFRANFKQLLHDWVVERRNSPSVILWGLQNESKLPEEFAKECTELIRQLDPTASSQRLVTTCNGGSGTDWDVPQNWTGTYGGNPLTYGEDLKKQILVGEYGAWRTLDLHSERAFVQNGIYSEDRITKLLEMKIRLAEAVRNSSTGQFMWLLTSHDNPGRAQSGEGFRELDRIGPVNYKGLLTPWEEPLDVYYMYRSNYASKKTNPMVYISSHTWPDRWTTNGVKSGIDVYSNCDEVELYNDVLSASFGRKKRGAIGTHFQWNDVPIKYNVLYAVGYVNGKRVAKDCIVLHHLPQAPNFKRLYTGQKNILQPEKGYKYLYRVNCGGPAYKDSNGNLWAPDREKNDKVKWGSFSWTKDFPGMLPFFASQRSTNDPINGTKDWKLFQSFRFGREKLAYEFPVQDGEYLVELYFTEPWVGGNAQLNGTGMRLFDVAVNGKIVLNNLDIWKEVGHNAALKKSVKVKVSGGLLSINFPQVLSGQAIISAIAIASLNQDLKAAPASQAILELLESHSQSRSSIEEWLNTGELQYSDKTISISSLPAELYGATWLKTPQFPVSDKGILAHLRVLQDADIYIGIDTSYKNTPAWLMSFNVTTSYLENNTGRKYLFYRKKFRTGEQLSLLAEGTIGRNMYPVVAVPATIMEPAFDLKPVITYKAINGKISGPSIVKGKVDGKDRVIFQKPSAANRIEWSISTGVADIYSITISYNNPLEDSIMGHFQLLSPGGTLLKEKDVTFLPTREGKNNYFTITTGTMINAGQYLIILDAPAAEQLSVNSLDVQ